MQQSSGGWKKTRAGLINRIFFKKREEKKLNKNTRIYFTSKISCLQVRVCYFTPSLHVCVIYLKLPFLEEKVHVNNLYVSLGGRSTASSLVVPFLHVSKVCSVYLKLPRQPVLSQDTVMPKNFLLWPPPVWRCGGEQPSTAVICSKTRVQESVSCHSKLILHPGCNALTPPRFTPLLSVRIKQISNT